MEEELCAVITTHVSLRSSLRQGCLCVGVGLVVSGVVLEVGGWGRVSHQIPKGVGSQFPRKQLMDFEQSG